MKSRIRFKQKEYISFGMPKDPVYFPVRSIYKIRLIFCCCPSFPFFKIRMFPVALPLLAVIKPQICCCQHVSVGTPVFYLFPGSGSSYFSFRISHCIFIAPSSEASFLFCSRFITINPVTGVCRSCCTPFRILRREWVILMPYQRLPEAKKELSGSCPGFSIQTVALHRVTSLFSLKRLHLLPSRNTHG